MNLTSIAPLLELKLRQSPGQACCSLVAPVLWPYSLPEVDKLAACPQHCTLRPSISNLFSLKLESIYLVVAQISPAFHGHVYSDRLWGCFVVVRFSALVELETAIFLSQLANSSGDNVCDILCDTIAKGDLYLFSALRASSRRSTRRRVGRGGK